MVNIFMDNKLLKKINMILAAASLILLPLVLNSDNSYELSQAITNLENTVDQIKQQLAAVSQQADILIQSLPNASTALVTYSQPTDIAQYSEIQPYAQQDGSSMITTPSTQLPNYYTILGVLPSASTTEITKAYRQQTLK